MGDLVLLGTAFAFGIGSALFPMFLNAEAYVVGLGVFVPKSMLAIVILSLGIGTVVGKAFVFELARRGSDKIRGTERKEPRNKFMAWLRRFSDWMLRLLDRPYAGTATVFASSLVGVPPLAIVTIIAGASKQPAWLFLTMVFLGRTLQFLAIAFIIHRVT